ncbi:TPA: DEAD/DEAH box helicase family protein, partial [Pasteurella multocida]|nr:DEAD/DEAH box helicase family protein [Pasteurella multocida]
MAKKPKKTIDDKDLLVGELKQRYQNYDLFGEKYEWDNTYIQANLKDKLRPYQNETLAFFHDTQRSLKSDTNFRHLLFNMATGAGKTMIMASLILYFFKEKNYQNFLFFVHTDGILQKTIDNLINNGVSKYLFTPTIEIDGKAIRIEKVDVFPKAPSCNTIYIKMATIGKIHADLNTVRENGISYEDLKETPLVMLADEAHHYNALTMNTKSDKEQASAWEKTIQRIFDSHDKNRLMEFTATLDLTNAELYNKYKDKIVQRYDLKKFMEDGYSKKVMLLQIDQDDRTKMLDAVLLSQYRKLIAIKNGILGFKPVILFKSNTIATSLTKHEDFDNLIANLSINEIQNHIQDKQRLLKGKETSVWHKVAAFYQQTDLQDVLTGIKHDFEPLKTFNANSNEMLDESNTKILNTLENPDNFFRVVFAVAKLSEGWDVLNLFDIVRMSEKAATTSNATNQEAQLIGRGARYFPFNYNDKKSTQRRFDGQNTELAILEQLYYHTINETSYINNLSRSLTQASLVTSSDGAERVLSAKVKNSFKKTDIYQQGKLYLNKTEKIDGKERTLDNYSDKEIFLSYKITDENLLTEIKNIPSLPIVTSNSIKIENLQLDKPYFQ